MNERFPALLLIGPTGSGKTPLGRQLELHGLGAKACIHFDFGENLRQAVSAPEAVSGLAPNDVDLLRQLLEQGLLLEDRDFPIAEKLLRSFLERSQAAPATVVVLNGLPRHIGQARALDRLLDICTVFVLNCAPDVVLARIQQNTGGDRTHRQDDSLAAVERKLETFHERTVPLIDYFESHDANIWRLEVTAAMTPEQMWDALQRLTDVQ